MKGEAYFRTLDQDYTKREERLDEAREKMQELADAMAEVSPSKAANAAARYAALKDYTYLTADGDKLAPKAYDTEVEYLREVLKRYIERNGPLGLEGVGTFKLQERSTAWSWDLRAMYENDAATFWRMLELGALTVNKAVADALKKAGQMTGYEQYGHPGGSVALVIEKERP